eukprot:CAMPEP_0185739476 /NCGR_PEP_ID=MMETSP1171-20130828/35540_1 /TAXON_ID=374046 /ORGANISM="Helicotheca tamensis, Strain CCMP826" /LENGTH=82 /DNA_ID=CAMNT_0028411057 /DNA_START=59 /DNA_END=310 /DNA_ORIENTATION=-
MCQYDYSRSSGSPFGYTWVCSGFGGTCITYFDDNIDGFECFGEETFGFGNVAGIPVDEGAGVSGGGGGVRVLGGGLAQLDFG